MSAPPKNVARKLFRFGSRNKKFSRHNEKLLVPVFQKTRTTIGAFSVRILYPALAPFLFSRPLHGDWRIFCLLIHCIIGSYFVYLSIKNSIIFLPWHTNPRIPMSM
ncbi:hypothetical protein CS548_10665 [Porphyromonas gingivalis]|nr:hypothetical protein CS548_10665 [Porphyromonas gingivalis]